MSWLKAFLHSVLDLGTFLGGSGRRVNDTNKNPFEANMESIILLKKLLFTLLCWIRLWEGQESSGMYTVAEYQMRKQKQAL